MTKMLVCGEIIKKDDEYLSSITKKWHLVRSCSVGQRLLDCNVGYYRHPSQKNESR